MVQNFFQRMEKKYLLSQAQFDALMARTAGKLLPDAHSNYTVSSLYYDTRQYDLIRASIEKPVYREKLRLRSYGKVNAMTPVFLELKKKCKGVVYKRREILPYQDAIAFLSGGEEAFDASQILSEIRYFLEMYTVDPTIYICCNRRAYTGAEDRELRVTFDTDIRFRQSELRLDNGTWGRDILEPGMLLMEIKTSNAFPVWLGRALSELSIFPTSFSKYGTCYREYIFKNYSGGLGVGVSA